MRKNLILYLGIFSKLRVDESGSILVYLTLVLTVLVGVAGLATEGSSWLYYHQMLQNAADSAALSAAASLSKGLDASLDSPTITSQVTTQAKAVAATYCIAPGNASTCLTDGANGVSVTVTPSIAPAAPTPPSVRVTISQNRSRAFSGLWQSGSQTIAASAVAILNSNSANCILALATTGQGVYVTFKNGKSTVNNLAINLAGCTIFSNSTSSKAIDIEGNDNSIVTNGIGAVGNLTWSGNSNPFASASTTSGDVPVPDPYANAAQSWPATCQTSCTVRTVPSGQGTVSMSPGVYSSMTLAANNTTYNLAPGVYYLQGDFNASGQHMVVNASGVTFVLMGNANFLETSNNAVINLIAPTTGWSAGLAIWAPTSTGTIGLTIGNSDIANIDGAVYTPNAHVEYDGNTATGFCTQIVAATVMFGGNSGGFNGNCNLPGMRMFGRTVALVE